MTIYSKEITDKIMEYGKNPPQFLKDSMQNINEELHDSEPITINMNMTIEGKE